MTDLIGHRLCGSPDYDRAADYMLNQLQIEDFDNIHAENATVPQWTRGREWATMRSPRNNYTLLILALGGSVGTKGEITADVMVVRSFDELDARAAAAKGKIVLFNQQCDWQTNPVSCYGTDKVSPHRIKINILLSLPP